MKTLNKLTAAVMACLMLVSGATFTSCSDDDDFSTQQYHGGVTLNVFGPSPVARGGELRFLGSGLDQITSITLPGSGDITDIKVLSANEIRITVPQDAEPGLVVLHYAKGDITTKTHLTFTEPISLDEITPLTVKPGETLTITGDYLNLINEVIFTDEVTVVKKDFISQSRYEIKLEVPAEAQTGKIIISDGAEIPNWIYSEDEVTVVLPSVAAVTDLSGAKPGETVTFTVNDIDLVTKVEMPNGDEVEFTVNEDKLSFVLPENVTDGTICMIPASGVKVAIATIGVAVPENVEAEPAENIWAGDVIKLKGVNMELVNTVTFPNVEEAVVPETKSATELTVKVPEGAQSGNLLLNTGSGVSVEVAVSTLKPEAVAYNPAPAALAGALEVSGRNLQNVATITFAGTTAVEVKNPETNKFSITVPATLSAGTNTVTLTLTNGEVVEVPAIELTAPECAYATELPGEDVEIYAGETFVVTIANEDKLTGVKVNGQNVQYILNGNRLIIQVPESSGKNATFTLVSSNGEISYEIAVIPATHVENVIFNQVIDLSWSGDEGVNKFRIYKESFDGVPTGALLVFHVTPAADAQIQVNDANWGEITTLKPAVGDATIALELDSETLDRILTTDDGWSTTALVIQGQNCVVNKVHVEWENSLETVIWNAGWICSGWGGNQDLAWGGYDWSTVKPGQILRLYTTPTLPDGEWWCISLRHGEGWGNLPAPIPDQYDFPANPLEVVLTADVLADIVAYGGLVITGSEYQLDKVTIE
ncbi:MAG: hypothetical protein K2J65_05290 [Duncaniella sp.]|nr:hypothetical protein [Duncaniella sp.]